MKLFPFLHMTAHEICVTDHLSMLGFEVIVKTHDDSPHYGNLISLHNITRVSWQDTSPGHNGKVVVIESVIHNDGVTFAIDYVEYVIIEMSVKMCLNFGS